MCDGGTGVRLSGVGMVRDFCTFFFFSLFCSSLFCLFAVLVCLIFGGGLFGFGLGWGFFCGFFFWGGEGVWLGGVLSFFCILVGWLIDRFH